MKMRMGAFWTRIRPFLLAFVSWLGLYLDDLLLICASVCFTTAAAQECGSSAALAVAGVCCLGCGVVVARSRKGGGG